MARKTTIQRKTNETAIDLTLEIDGTGQRRIATPVPFFNHMLEAVAKHGLYDLEVNATGDVDVDPHHTVEDVGICFGKALVQCGAASMRSGDSSVQEPSGAVGAAVPKASGLAASC